MKEKGSDQKVNSAADNPTDPAQIACVRTVADLFDAELVEMFPGSMLERLPVVGRA